MGCVSLPGLPHRERMLARANTKTQVQPFPAQPIGVIEMPRSPRAGVIRSSSAPMDDPFSHPASVIVIVLGPQPPAAMLRG